MKRALYHLVGASLAEIRIRFGLAVSCYIYCGYRVTFDDSKIAPRKPLLIPVHRSERSRDQSLMCRSWTDWWPHCGGYKAHSETGRRCSVKGAQLLQSFRRETIQTTEYKVTAGVPSKALRSSGKEWTKPGIKAKHARYRVYILLASNLCPRA